ncbi:DEAD/DEAH box helicase [Clostridium taeniosporum]|uniref:ATP-dependent helicase n=1 Tax=Clostridium taeniosporum TaxID=394958 RepID=A0A1D7XKH9_9CLOT|nr:DEAD/DEAH box helicase [Clostridium taeniosporum]AOR23853.1 ATP-dependent helicase [Clostridium taeniosporum]
MKLLDLELQLLKSISKISLVKGKDIIKNKMISRLNGKKFKNSYNIYGKIKGEKCKEYNPHLRIDLKSGKVILAKCECHEEKYNENINDIIFCEHLSAIVLTFFDKVKKQNKKSNIETIKKTHSKYILNEENNKELLEIDVVLNEVKDKNGNYFETSFFIGDKTKYLVNIKEFIESYINKEDFYIARGLIYCEKKYYFSEKDKKIIEFLEEYLSVCRGKLFDSSIRLFPANIRRFLNIMCEKRIKFKFNYQNYLCDVKTAPLPISFTIKKVRENYIITTKKNFPIPLNKKMNSFLFDRNIYIPPMNQLKIYINFYKDLKKYGKIILQKDIDIRELNKIIETLNNITSEVNIDKEIIDDLDGLINFKFHSINSYTKSIKVKIIREDLELDYAHENINSNIIIKRSRKVRNVESEMNKLRFFYRNGEFIFQGNDDEYYEFLKNGLDKIKQIGMVSNLGEERAFNLFNGSFINYNLKRGNEQHTYLEFSLDDFNRNDLNKMYIAWKDKKSYIKLNDESFVDLEDKDMENFFRIVESLNIDIISADNLYKIDNCKLYYLNEKLNDKRHNVIGREILKEAVDKLENINEEKIVIPINLNATLRGYQVKGYKWLKNLSRLGFGGILADEMGLGKTIQVISFLLSEQNKKSMVITPTSLIYNWADEFKKFAPSLKVGIIHGDLKLRNKTLNNKEKYDVLITTYGTLRNDYLKYKNTESDYLIIDEAQNINNPKAKVTEIVKGLKAKNRFALTGTPVENNLTDLWSLFDFIMPGYLFSKDEFSKRFINNNELSKQELKVMISPYILRRLKKDVIKELPDKIENKFFVEMTENQKKLYKTYIKEIQKKLKEIDNGNNKITLFSYLTRLRQLCLDPSIIVENYDGGSGKINIAKDLIKKAINNNHKILLFSQFTSVLNKICNELKYEQISYLYLDGSTSPKDRIKLVHEFNNNQDIKLFLISLKAGGTGLNLTSADMVIHFDPWWNPAIEDQATDRAHRIGQRNIVQVIKLITKESIEEKILLLQEDKKELIEDVITGELKEDGLVNKMNMEALIELLKL